LITDLIFISDPITINEILELIDLEVQVLERSLSASLETLLDGNQSSIPALDKGFPRSYHDIYQHLCESRIGNVIKICLNKKTFIQIVFFIL